MATEFLPRTKQSNVSIETDAAEQDSGDDYRLDPVAAAQALHDTELLLQAQLEDARLLQELSARLIEQHGAQDLYEQFVDAAMTLMHAQFGTMQMLREDESGHQRLELIVHRNFDPESVDFWYWIEAHETTSCGIAMITGERSIIEDLEAVPSMQGTRDLEMFRREGIAAVQSTPLRSRTGRSLGMISTHWSEPHYPTERELRLFDILARQAADLMEQRQDMELLQQREAELRSALEARNVFLGLVSHELRTPIAIVSANVELMRRAIERNDTERLTDIQHEMAENIDRTSRTVDNMLALARIEAGTISEAEPVLPARLAEGVAARHRRWNPTRTIALIDNSSLHPVLSHADHIEQVLDNLLSNALKYSDGAIEIEVIAVVNPSTDDSSADDSWITAHVRDRGPGIPDDVTRALFQPFTRGAEHATIPGIGLGLNVCRRLIEVHHGRIWAENRPDGGADFAFSLPAAAAPFD